MNKDLDSFTVERLEKWIATGEEAKDHHDGVRVAGEYLAALARIALAAKMAEPCGYAHKNAIKFDLHDTCRLHEQAGDENFIALYTTPQLNSPEIQEGWKLVPKEATLAMLTLLGLTGSFESMQERYANMLSAAPEKPL